MNRMKLLESKVKAIRLGRLHRQREEGQGKVKRCCADSDSLLVLRVEVGYYCSILGCLPLAFPNDISEMFQSTKTTSVLFLVFRLKNP